MQMREATKFILQNTNQVKMIQISIRDFLGLPAIPCDIYGLINGEFKIIIMKSSSGNNVNIKRIVLEGHTSFFAYEDEHKLLIDAQVQNLVTNTRSLSIGDTLGKASNQLNLLSTTLRYLYNCPSNDELLKIQVQSVKNLAKFLISNPKIIGPLIENYLGNGHHYVLAQPMVSSIFLVGILKRSALFSDREIENLFGILKRSALFSDREIENLFITSYFKDIGMSTIPERLLFQKELSEEDITILMEHAKQSEQILKGRVGITNTYMDIIKNHHTHSLLGANIDKEQITIHGLETVIISILDIISAMTNERPYRKATPLFDALNLVKPLMADNYTHEYRMIVNFFKNLFDKH